jgi:hypothetical protein
MEGRQEGVEPLDRAMISRLWAMKWRQSHGVIAQCNSARTNPRLLIWVMGLRTGIKKSQSLCRSASPTAKEPCRYAPTKLSPRLSAAVPSARGAGR